MPPFWNKVYEGFEDAHSNERHLKQNTAGFLGQVYFVVGKMANATEMSTSNSRVHGFSSCTGKNVK